MSPDALVDAVKAAKIYEVQEHPETSNFKFDGETELNSDKKSNCVIC